MLAPYGLLCGFVYGWMLDFAFWPFSLGMSNQLGYSPGAPAETNLYHFALYKLATAMAWDAGRGLSNLVLILVLGAPLLGVLRRADRRAFFTPDDAPHAAS